MDEKIHCGVVTFRYTKDNIELLLVDFGKGITHPKGRLLDFDNLEKAMIAKFTAETGLSLIVASLQPLCQFYSIEKRYDKEIKITTYYYAGITDPDQEVLLRDESFEYIWADHLGGRNALSSTEDIEAYEYGRTWLYDHEEAALFLANNLQKLL
ncbi:MAG: hypothetical protein GPJ54_17830 [Candidatus Heimdallarchaeota archaeon]|nr:hypothetical protein [Candidatus Heimdallarchaeota archaeon]